MSASEGRRLLGRPMVSATALLVAGTVAVTPSRTRIEPLGTLKLRSFRTTWSSKASDTFSNTTAAGSSAIAPL